MVKVDISFDEKHLFIECTPTEGEQIRTHLPGAVWEGLGTWRLRVRAELTVLIMLKDLFKYTTASKECAQWALTQMSRKGREPLPKYFFHGRWGDLRKYQQEGVKAILSQKSLLLADEMGLGKTIQALVAIEGIVGPMDHPRVLIICPSCVKNQWAQEIYKWGQKWEAVPVVAPGMVRRKMSPGKRKAEWDRYVASGSRYFIIHWEALRLMPQLLKFKWDWVIGDEAHYIKNRKAKRTMMAFGLKADRRVLLTGTPIINKPDELWSLLHFLAPKQFRSYWRFFNAFVDFIDLPFGRKIIGTKNVLELQKVLLPWCLRRLKKDHLTELPPVIETTIEVDMLAAQRRMYKRVLDEVLLELEENPPLYILNAITRLLKLRQVASSSSFIEGKDISGKLDAAVELTKNAVDSGECVVVFCWFRRTADLMVERLRNAGMIVGRFHGGTGDGGLRDFLDNDRYKVLVTTIGAGGIGLNLQKASTGIFVESSWTPAENSQARARLHRMGQYRPVNIIHLLSKGTVDAAIARKLRKKEKMMSEILSLAEVVSAAKGE